MASWEGGVRAFSPLVIVGVASPILVVMVTVFYIMKEWVHNPILSQIRTIQELLP